MKLDHVAIAVSNLDEVVRTFKDILGVKPEIVTDEERGLKIAIFKLENVKLEFMQPVREETAISNFLKKRGNAIHHIALKVDNLENYMHLPRIGDVQEGITAKKVIFLDLNFTHRILTELVSD